MGSKKQQVRFNTADDEQLIEIVSGYPILWDMKLQEFKNVVKKDIIWNEICFFKISSACNIIKAKAFFSFSTYS